MVTEPGQSSWCSSQEAQGLQEVLALAWCPVVWPGCPGEMGRLAGCALCSPQFTKLGHCAACPRPGSAGVGLLLPADYLKSPMSRHTPGGHLSHGFFPTSQPDLPSPLIMAGLDGPRSASLILCSRSAKTTPNPLTLKIRESPPPPKAAQAPSWILSPKFTCLSFWNLLSLVEPTQLLLKLLGLCLSGTSSRIFPETSPSPTIHFPIITSHTSLVNDVIT